MNQGTGAGASLEEDPQLKGLLAELVVEAGREEADTAMLEVQRPAAGARSCGPSDPASAGARRTGISAPLRSGRRRSNASSDRAYGRVLEETGERT